MDATAELVAARAEADHLQEMEALQNAYAGHYRRALAEIAGLPDGAELERAVAIAECALSRRLEDRFAPPGDGILRPARLMMSL